MTQVPHGDTSEETSAEWADRLQLYDAGEFEALKRLKKSTAQRHQSALTTDILSPQDQASPVSLSEQQWSDKTLEPSPLTSRIRQRLRGDDDTMGRPSEVTCALLVRQVSPSLLSKLYTQSRPPCAVLFAYFDACPYSRAAEDGLVSLAKRMHRRNLSLAKHHNGTGADFCIMMYDIRAKGNRTFAVERLHASPVPKLYTVVPQSRAIVPWTGEPFGEVRPSATSNEWTRTIPEDALFNALSEM